MDFPQQGGPLPTLIQWRENKTATEPIVICPSLSLQLKDCEKTGKARSLFICFSRSFSLILFLRLSSLCLSLSLSALSPIPYPIVCSRTFCDCGFILRWWCLSDFKPIPYPKPDNVISFDILTNLARRSGGCAVCFLCWILSGLVSFVCFDINVRHSTELDIHLSASI